MANSYSDDDETAYKAGTFADVESGRIAIACRTVAAETAVCVDTVTMTTDVRD